ncbi:unnamed protein product [Caenorhabditis auriculariae]|uniref:Uncharacterized protein n=1 Tax=Caenorhabditis auriculariae TaxID=2777116 RepID=A0A8S1GXT0_9PELO|nr:unnamed protein product [Caenorhabditis auriculariae]
MSGDLEKIVHEAGTAYSEGRYEDAQILYEKAILSHPTNGILYSNLSAILLKLNNVADALKQAERAVQISPTWAKAHYRKGEALKKVGDTKNALVSLCNGARLDPSNCQILKSLLDLAQDFPFNQLKSLDLEVDRSTVLSTVGQSMIHRGDFHEAITVLGWAEGLEPRSLKLRESTLSSLAAAHCHCGNYARAVDYYEQQLELCQELGEENIAIAAELWGNFHLACLQRSHRLSSNVLSAREKLDEKMKIAENYLNLKQFEEAILLLDECQSPVCDVEDVKNIQRIRGIANAEMGRHEIARELLLPLLSGPPKESEVVIRIRIIDAVNQTFVAEKDLNSSIEFLNSSLCAATKYNKPCLFLHCCYLLCQSQIVAGNLPIALKLAKRILKFSRGNKENSYEGDAYRLLAMIYENQRDITSAIVLWKRFISVVDKAEKKKIEALLSLARLSEDESNPECPEIFLKEAVRLAERSCDVTLRVPCLSARFKWSLQVGKQSTASEDIEKMKALLENDLDSNLRSLIFEDVALWDKQQGTSLDIIHPLEQSLTEAQDGNDSKREMQMLGQLGDALFELGKHRQAEGYFKQQLEVARQLRSARAMADSHRNLARANLALCKYADAAEHSRSGLTLFKMIRDNEGRIEMLMLLSRTENKRDNLDVAMTALEKAISLAEECDSNRFLATGYRLIADVYSKNSQDEEMVMESVRRHISLFEYEENVLDKCRSLLDLCRYELRRPRSFGLLRIFLILRPLLEKLPPNERYTLLLDASLLFSSSSVDMSIWLIQRAIFDLSEDKDKEKIVLLLNQVQLLPTFVSCIALLTAVQLLDLPELDIDLSCFANGCSESKLAQLIISCRLQNWQKVSVILEYWEDFPVVPMRLMSTDSSVFVRKVKVRTNWSFRKQIDLTNLPPKERQQALSMFFDEFPSLLGTNHQSMLADHFDMFDKSHTLLEKIICASFLEECDCLAMWYSEMLREFERTSLSMVSDPIPPSDVEWKTKMATAFVALTMRDPLQQISTLVDGNLLNNFIYAFDPGFCFEIFWVFEEIAKTPRILWKKNDLRMNIFDHFLWNVVKPTAKTIDVINLSSELDPQCHNVQAFSRSPLLNVWKMADSNIAIIDAKHFDVPAVALLHEAAASNYIVVKNGPISQQYRMYFFLMGTRAIFEVVDSSTDLETIMEDGFTGSEVSFEILAKLGVTVIYSSLDSQSKSTAVLKNQYFSTLRKNLFEIFTKDDFESCGDLISFSKDVPREIALSVLKMSSCPTKIIEKTWRMSKKHSDSINEEYFDEEVANLLRGNPTASRFYETLFSDHIYDYQRYISRKSSLKEHEHNLSVGVNPRDRPQVMRIESRQSCSG